MAAVIIPGCIFGNVFGSYIIHAHVLCISNPTGIWPLVILNCMKNPMAVTIEGRMDSVKRKRKTVCGWSWVLQIWSINSGKCIWGLIADRNVAYFQKLLCYWYRKESVPFIGFVSSSINPFLYYPVKYKRSLIICKHLILLLCGGRNRTDTFARERGFWVTRTHKNKIYYSIILIMLWSSDKK